MLVKLPVQGDRVFGGFSKKQNVDNKKYNYAKMQNYYGYYGQGYGDNYGINYQNNAVYQNNKNIKSNKGQSQSNVGSYVRFKPINNKKYK